MTTPNRTIGPTDPSAIVTAIAERIARARSVAVLTGAGMSAESGIATFRGADDSLWSEFDPHVLATANAFRRDPALVWAWYSWRAAQVARAQPNAGHLALSRLQASRPALHLITQNVDDLHERAGSTHVIHLHSNLFTPRCFACARAHTMEGDAIASAQPPLRIEPPRCGHCGGRIRPGVIWFGEPLPKAEWKRARHSVLSSQVVLLIGTSGEVQPAASLPEQARRAGAFVVEINPAPTALSDMADLVWRSTAATALPTLANALSADHRHQALD